MSLQRFSTNHSSPAVLRIPSLSAPASGASLPRAREAAPQKYWTRSVKEQAMENYGISYFRQLTTDYLSIPNPQPNSIQAQLNALVAKPNAPTDWDDVYSLERGLIAVSPDAQLRARLPFLRSEFESAATADEFQDYLRTGPPDAQNAPIDKVRADALALIDQIQWRSITIPFFEELRTHLMGQIVLATGAYHIFALFLLYMLSKYENEHTCFHIIAAILCGILGGALSTIQRIQSMPSNAGALTNLSSLEGQNLALLASPLIGGTSAALLFYLCAGGILPASVFPALSSVSAQPTNSLQAFVGIEAAGCSNAAKLVVWSFVAGFSERFIPDTVSRLTAKLSS